MTEPVCCNPPFTAETGQDDQLQAANRQAVQLAVTDTRGRYRYKHCEWTHLQHSEHPSSFVAPHQDLTDPGHLATSSTTQCPHLHSLHAAPSSPAAHEVSVLSADLIRCTQYRFSSSKIISTVKYHPQNSLIHQKISIQRVIAQAINREIMTPTVPNRYSHQQSKPAGAAVPIRRAG